jgi:hypothetical protein
MTATPIPRTLAMTLYGDLDVSVIDELTPGRKPVQTTHVFDNRLTALYDGIRRQIHEGRQVYIVFPLIEESEKSDLKNLEQGFEVLCQAFPEFRLSKVHGRMKPKEKEQEMLKFVKGETQILVATTVIEVGVNVPNASVMVILDAQRFGLSQLHQLRGRVGRGADQSFCILVTNYKLSDDITFRFSDWSWDQFPLTADKLINWISACPKEEDVFNLFMNYETFGELQSKETGIFEFLKAIPRMAEKADINFETPANLFSKKKPIDRIDVPYTISWSDEERDTSAWLGNELQRSAFNILYSIRDKVRLCTDRKILQDWYYLQTSDHFYYMSTKHFSDGAVHNHFSPYETPFEAFTNYMNVLSDFMIRVREKFPEGVDVEELNSLMKTIDAQGKIIAQLEQMNPEFSYSLLRALHLQDNKSE